MDAGLVKGEGFVVDASIIKADVSRQCGVPSDELVNLSTRAVREYLEALGEEACMITSGISWMATTNPGYPS